MTVLEVGQRFPDQESCFRYLEEKRWGDTPECPYCGSKHVARKRENRLVGRWNCYECKSSFNALSGTVLQGTRIPLVKWFAMIVLLLNAKKSISCYQLARDLGLKPNTAWLWYTGFVRR